jgi:hypothetical protein
MNPWICGIVVLAVLFFAWALFRAAARGDRQIGH